MNPWITNLIIPLILAGATTLMGYAVWLLQEQRKEQAEARKVAAEELGAIKNGLMLEIQRNIINDHSRYVIDKEPLLPLAYKNLTEVYEAYKKLGGNGMAEKLMQEIEKRHIEKGGIQ